MANETGRRAVALTAALAAVAGLAAACAGAAARPAVRHDAAPLRPAPAAPPVGPHGGVDLDLLVVTDGTPAVESIRQELSTEGIPSAVVNLKHPARQEITRAFLARTLPGGGKGGNFDGVVLPGPSPAGLSAAEDAVLITGFVNTQFLQNFAWAGQNGIPVERDAVAPGEYTGLRILPSSRRTTPTWTRR